MLKPSTDTLGLSPQDTSANYYDLQSLDNLRKQAHSGDKKQALEQAAKQFEAIFVRMMLKSMRDAQDALADEDSPFNSSSMKFYRDMNDQQLASQMSQNGNMGLADVVLRQLGGDENYKNADLLNSDTRFNTTGVNSGMDISSIQRVKQALLTQLSVDKDKPVNTATDVNDLPANAATASNTSKDKAPAFETPEQFVQYLLPLAKKAANALGIDPKALVAQAALETNWGKQVIQHNQGSSHNLFGIKADQRWQGNASTVSTLEFINGVPERQHASFRAYGSFDESLQDYVNFVKGSPRYSNAVAQADNTQAYFENLQQGGYATDPEYANKIMRVMDSSPFDSAFLSHKGAK